MASPFTTSICRELVRRWGGLGNRSVDIVHPSRGRGIESVLGVNGDDYRHSGRLHMNTSAPHVTHHAYVPISAATVSASLSHI